MRFIDCKDCKYYQTEKCIVTKTFEEAVLTPDSGCTEGEEKND